MIPLYDDNPTQRSAVLVYVLIAANVLIFLHESMLGSPQLARLLDAWAVIPR